MGNFFMKKQDFSKLSSFPGRDGNPLDKILHYTEELERIPFLLFFLFLGFLSFIPNFHNLLNALYLLLFFLGDWLLLSQLPKQEKSFGPAKPPVLILAILRIIFSFIPGPTKWILQFIGSLLVIYGFWIEPHKIKVSFQTFRTGKLKKDNHFTMMHLSDLHLEKTSKREKQLLELLQKIKPDILLFSGDFLNLSYIRNEKAIKEAGDLVGKWTAPLGVFCVSGSPAVDQPEAVERILHSTQTVYLNNNLTQVNINGDIIDLYGLSCTHMPHIDSEILRSINHKDSKNLKILLFHSPDLAPDAVEAGMDIMLSGHTHGGQVRIPFIGALVTGSLYGKRFEAGPYELEQMRLYVSRGIGMEGAGAPRVRFLCPPEIIVWDIRGN